MLAEEDVGEFLSFIQASGSKIEKPFLVICIKTIIEKNCVNEVLLSQLDNEKFCKLSEWVKVFVDKGVASEHCVKLLKARSVAIRIEGVIKNRSEFNSSNAISFILPEESPPPRAPSLPYPDLIFDERFRAGEPQFTQLETIDHFETVGESALQFGDVTAELFTNDVNKICDSPDSGFDPSFAFASKISQVNSVISIASGVDLGHNEEPVNSFSGFSGVSLTLYGMNASMARTGQEIMADALLKLEELKRNSLDDVSAQEAGIQMLAGKYHCGVDFISSSGLAHQLGTKVPYYFQ
ncbi:hypothetical protein [Endozoicomonas ascidiicola]|uniref:hypothetical protein n=1 Tax=Endozoicomonas ascidiicola TaxID=1698521 RepID=UPI0008314BF9|nr:hypothetical protein [Endozoicomonas ascidiicola]